MDAATLTGTRLEQVFGGEVTHVPERIRLAPGQRWCAGDKTTVVLIDEGEVEWALDVSVGGGTEAMFRRFFIAAGTAGSVAIGEASGNSTLSMVALEASAFWLLDETLLRRLSGAGRSDLADALDSWIVALAKFTCDGVHKYPQALPGADFHVEANDRLACNYRVAWIPAGAPIRLLDTEHARVAGPVPITGGVFARFTDAAAGSLTATAEALARDNVVQGVSLLFRLAAAAAEQRAVAEERKSLERIDSVRRSESSRIQAATARFNGLLGRVAGDGGRAGLAAGAMALLEELGVPARPGGERRDETALDAGKRTIAAAGVRWREVTLEKDWWREGGETMVVVSQDGRRTHAVYPRLRGGFLIQDEPGALKRRLRDAEAQALGATALAVHAPLTGADWTPGKLFRYALSVTSLPVFVFALYVLLSGLVSIFTPLATGWIIDPIVPLADRGSLTVVIGLLLAVALIGSLVQTAQSLLVLRIEGLLDNRVQSAVWDRLLRLPASFFRQFRVGDLANRSTSINQMRALMSTSTMAAAVHSISGLLSLALMFYYNWLLALVGAIVALIYVAIVYFLRRRIVLANRVILKLSGDLQALVLQIVSGINRIRLSGAQERVFALWAEPYARLIAQNIRQSDLTNVTGAIGKAMGSIPLASILLVLGLNSGVFFAMFETPQNWSDITGATLLQAFPPHTFVIFNAAFGQFIAALTGLITSALSLVQIGPLYERMAPIVKEVQEDEHSDAGETLTEPLGGRVELAGVSFRYAPDYPLVLQDVSFTAEPGQFVAVVGPSGAGKSSIVRLLLGFDRPEAGTVLYDGRDLVGLPVREVRRNLGVVLQDGRVMAGSIFQNIAMGAPLTEARVWRAAEQAGIADDIRSLPMGMETFVNDGGAVLSGGQRQRLMIARALARHPRLLILDEATSALDNRTQAIITKAIDELNITRIVIAHRLSTIINADKIVVLDNGHVVEQGTYEELMRLGGTFTALARRQLRS
jgi:NHLM bacteriocin system ABC transporter ATP-binding protein